MLFKSKENWCLLQVLKILSKKNSNYGKLFKETKVSHTTLQRALHYLVEKQFINKNEQGYAINIKGKILLEKLNEINSILV